MAVGIAATHAALHKHKPRIQAGLGDSTAVRTVLILVALGFLGLFVMLPILLVFTQALSSGVKAYLVSIAEPDTRAAIRLTLLAALVAVPLNLIFGIAASWLISKYRFRGKAALLSLIDLPFSVSPVISGLVFVLLLGARGILGPWMEAHDFHVIFALPGIILATTFVTFPFVVREVLPVMQELGSDEEEAALTLGAGGWQILFHVTLPKIRWGLMYGVVLCNARAMGEFGAVSVVSGHIRGVTNTIPLQVEILYNEYNIVAAFSVASILTLLALGTLGAKKLVETRQARE
ncbi:MAG: sulfate ABC transporter permease subunit CysW [Polyangia bacterium]